MIPVFKSTFSNGRSILQVAPQKKEGGADSIIDICKEHGLKKLVLVEDVPTGFMQTQKLCEKEGIQLIFGLRFTCCNNTSNENSDSDHKVIIFAKNDNGCQLLNKIFSESQLNHGGKVDFDLLEGLWSDDVALVIPFYDSFLHKNTLEQGNCIPRFSKITPTFFIENNKHAFDEILLQKIGLFAANKFNIELTKSIYYKNRSDYEALQTYKILCNRSFGKERTLDRPELNHFCSKEFCWESYLDNERRIAKV